MPFTEQAFIPPEDLERLERLKNDPNATFSFARHFDLPDTRALFAMQQDHATTLKGSSYYNKWGQVWVTPPARLAVSVLGRATVSQILEKSEPAIPLAEVAANLWERLPSTGSEPTNALVFKGPATLKNGSTILKFGFFIRSRLVRDEDLALSGAMVGILGLELQPHASTDRFVQLAKAFKGGSPFLLPEPELCERTRSTFRQAQAVSLGRIHMLIHRPGEPEGVALKD